MDSTLTFSPALAAALALTPNKTQWGIKLNEMLGNNRRVRCFRDSDPAAVNPFLTGTEFLSIGNTGALTVKSGMIAAFGTLSGATIQLPADLATGSSILRIEGNGHWVQGKLGLLARNQDTDPNNNVDFTLNASPTARTGVAMVATMGPPRLKPSGTGPVAPGLDDRRPFVVELVNYKDERNPIVVGSLTLNVRDDDLVYEHPWLAGEMGDIRITGSNESIVYDDFEFGAKMFAVHSGVNSVAGETYYEVLLSCKPYDRWSSYPAMDSYNDIGVRNYIRPVKNGSTYGVGLQAELPGAVADKVVVTAIDATNFTVVSEKRGKLPNAQLGVAYYGGTNETEVEKAPFYFKLAEPTAIKVTNPDGSVTETPNPWKTGDVVSFEIYHTVDPTKPTDVTHPPPFKAIIRGVNNQVLGTIQQRDGLPVNSPKLQQRRQPFEGMRPLSTCAMMWPWRSARPKMNSKAYQFSPKPVADSIRTQSAQQPSSFNGAVPMVNYYGGNVNTQNHYHAAPKWPLGWESGAANDAQDPHLDDIVFDCRTYYTSSTGPNKLLARAIGWAYEPGSISGHDWYTGPGGPRIDRMCMASPIAQYLWNPKGIRKKDGSTYEENVDAWALAYFNHSCHYVRNVKTFETLPVDEVMAGKWSYSRAYYGGTDNYVTGGLTRHISQWAIAKQSGYLKKDRLGRPVWNGWALDQLHAYGMSVGWIPMLFNSPMFIVAHKHRFIATWMAQLLGVNPKLTAGFMERNGAWRWLSFAMAWTLGTKHPLGISQAVVEDRWRIDIENIHKTYVVPATDPTHPDYNKPEVASLRGLGMMSNSTPGVRDAADYMPPVEDTGEDGEPVLNPATGKVHAYSINSNGLTWYMAHVFLLMKTSGSFERMYNLNQKCKETLDFMIQCLDKFSIEFMLDAQGRCEGGYPYLSRPVPTTEPAVFPPTSWLEWGRDHFPRKGLEDWSHNEAGDLIKERDIGQHNRAMWVMIRKHWLTQNPHPRLDAAVAEYQRHYDLRKQRVADRANSSAFDRRNSDWNYRVAGFHFPSPPAENPTVWAP